MKIEKERERLRKIQSRKVMPLIGNLLDQWDDLPNDVKSFPELERIAKIITKIDDAMEAK